MNTHQLHWKLNLFKGIIEFYDGGQSIGNMPTLSLFSKYSLVCFKDERFHIHTQGISGKEYRIYNRTNEDLLATVTINFWNSSAQLISKKKKYLFSSKFLGVSGAKWNTDHHQVMSFSNQLVKGKVSTNTNDEYSSILLFISGLQLISYFSFLFLAMFVVVFIVIL